MRMGVKLNMYIMLRSKEAGFTLANLLWYNVVKQSLAIITVANITVNRCFFFWIIL